MSRCPLSFRSIAIRAISQTAQIRNKAIQTAEQVRSAFYPSRVIAPISAWDICEELDIQVNQYPGREFAYIRPLQGGGWIIELADRDYDGYKRSNGANEWIIAHELGHTFLDVSISGRYSPTEYFCDVFATALHLPPWMAEDLNPSQRCLADIDPTFPRLPAVSASQLALSTRMPRSAVNWALYQYRPEQWFASVRDALCEI